MVYKGAKLLQISMPMGGIGAGCICLNGYGGLQDFSIYNKPALSAQADGHHFRDAAFALLHIKGKSPITRLIEGTIPREKVYNQGLQGQGYRGGGHEGLPRFESAEFENRYPFGIVRLKDRAVPVKVELEGWSPFVPSDEKVSGMPASILTYTIENVSDQTFTIELSYHAAHMAQGKSGETGTRNHLLANGQGVLFSNTEDSKSESFGTAALAVTSPEPKVKGMWFRGGWFDSISALYREVSTGSFSENDGSRSELGQQGRNGGSILVPMRLKPGAKRTVSVILAWHFPNVDYSVGIENNVKLTWNPWYTTQWNYAQAFAHMFPALERTLREQEYMRSMDPTGHVNFRSALPDNPTTHNFHAAADGQLGGIMKLWRDYYIFGDQDWLGRLYPLAKKALDYCIETWDPGRIGVLIEPHHNTYDIEFWGADGMCTSIYIGALCALADLAKIMGDDRSEDEYRKLANRGAKYMDSKLFNGEYYVQKVQWEGLKDCSFTEHLSKIDTDTLDDVDRLLKAEGPKYQYGTGCLSDGVIGAWMAKLYGIETPLNKENVRSHLRSIARYNYREDLSDHACLQRPGYAIGHEKGLLLCTWPKGKKPTLPFVYSDEVWTGIEYQVASHCFEEGLDREGMRIVEGTRSRYDGHIRNPFNEYECGNYYARALASYALLQSVTGFRYSDVTKEFRINPQPDGFKTFFCVDEGFGIAEFEGKFLKLQMIEGGIKVRRVTVGDRSFGCQFSVDRFGPNRFDIKSPTY